MSEQEIKGKITNYEHERSKYNKNNPKESSFYMYYSDMIERFTDKLPKTKFNIHRAPEETCESCQ
jgi:hypothetical protein